MDKIINFKNMCQKAYQSQNKESYTYKFYKELSQEIGSITEVDSMIDKLKNFKLDGRQCFKYIEDGLEILDEDNDPGVSVDKFEYPTEASKFQRYDVFSFDDGQKEIFWVYKILENYYLVSFSRSNSDSKYLHLVINNGKFKSKINESFGTSAKIIRSEVIILKNLLDVDCGDPFSVNGQVTFDSEGNDNSTSIYFSRVAHHPSFNSGVTIGRGYDMKDRSISQVKNDLINSGIPINIAGVLSLGAGLKGQEAENFINNNKYILITPCQQKKLFELTYGDYLKLVDSFLKNIDFEYTLSDIKSPYSEILVDLRYRGDLTKASFNNYKQYINTNITLFYNYFTNSENWVNVPNDRFKRRHEFISDYL